MYLPTIAQHSLKWQEQIVWALDGHIFPVFGRTPISQVKRVQIQAFLMAKMLGKKKLSRSSVGHLRKIMFAVLSLAEADEVITRNPVVHVKLPPARRVATRPYSMEEIARILDAARGHICYNAIYCAATLGLRRGECIGLQWADIRGDRIHVSRQGPEGEPLKTSASTRTIPLPEGWVDGLEKCDGPWISPERNADHLLGRKTRKTEKGIILTGRGYTRAVEVARVRHLPFHSLRKSVATALEESLCPQGLIGAILGHASSSVTRLYIHDSEKVMREALQRVYDRLPKSGVQTPETGENGAA